jgi:hypothetical protein
MNEKRIISYQYMRNSGLIGITIPECEQGKFGLRNYELNNNIFYSRKKYVETTKRKSMIVTRLDKNKNKIEKFIRNKNYI